MPQPLIFEGTWDELAVHAEELQGKTLRLTVVGDETERLQQNGTGPTLADALKGYIGAIDSGGAESLSVNGGEKFTEYLLQKHKEGHL